MIDLSKLHTERISFFSYRDKLEGELHYLKKTSLNIPAVIFAHGYCNNRDELGGLRELAYYLCEKGYAVLQFDQTGCGESCRTIEKGKMFPSDWASNVSSGVSFLLSHKRVDSNRIGALGTSMGGAVVCYASAFDTRIKCTISLAGIGDGKRWISNLWLNNKGEEAWNKFLTRLEKDRIKRALTGRSEYVSLPEILPFSDYDMEFYKQIIQTFPKFITNLPLECVDDILMFKPENSAHLISPRAICYIHGEEDSLVLPSESSSLFEKTKEPKELHVIPDVPHILTDPSLDQKEEIYSTISNFTSTYL